MPRRPTIGVIEAARSGEWRAPVPSATRVIISKLAATAAGVDHERLAGHLHQAVAGGGQLLVVEPGDRLGERHQLAAVGQAGVALTRRDGGEIGGRSGLDAAPTEHR